MNTDTLASTGSNEHSRAMARRAAMGSFFGSAVEYYDFFIYGTAAALVFNKIFFPGADATAGMLAALATFGAGYIARPLGALLFGHLGDRMGRKPVLLLTLLMMGLATFLIGVLPTYDAIGAWAPALLVMCRLLQGLSAGGEQVGASLLTLEHAPDKKRGLYTSWLLNGSATGSILATLIFIPISSLPNDQLLAWGWRVPFLLSAVMVVITFLIRRGVEESPEFAARKQENQPTQTPVITLIRHESRALVTVFCCALVAVVSSLVTVFGLSYATNTFHVDKPAMLSAIAASQFVALFCHPLFGAIGDKVGRKRVFVLGTLASAAGVFLYLWSISTGAIALIVVSIVLLKGIVYAAPNGLWPSFYAEMFTPGVRYSGVGIATQLSFLVMGFAPSICYALLGDGAFGWVPVACFVGGLCLVSAIAAMSSKMVGQETGKPSLSQV